MEQARSRRLVLVLAVVALLLIVGPGLTGFFVDWLWFGEMHQRGVFWTLVNTRILLGLISGALLAVLIGVNFGIARRSAPSYTATADAPEWMEAARAAAKGALRILTLAGTLVPAVAGGLIASAEVEDWIRFRHPQPFGARDPIFHQDIGFYVFQYPFLRFLAGWCFGSLILTAVLTGLYYYLNGAVAVMQRRASVPGRVQAHVCVLLGLACLARAWGLWLDRYGLLLKSGSVVSFGAGYTDIHARLPALILLCALTVIAALCFFANVRMRRLGIPVAALVVLLLGGIIVGGVYPGLIQQLVVGPDEQARERPYLQHHLDATRTAYGLTATQIVNDNPAQPISAKDLRTERGTLDNIRLWDYRVIAQTYHGVQRLRDYYDVSDVDVDRYTVGGRYRQVMLAPRELLTERLDPQQHRWVNQMLQYTHGYGLVMSTVNEADPSGRPVWLVRDLPLVGDPAVLPTRPQIYYGMQEHPPVVAPSRTPEFDFPIGSDIRQSTYSGPGGIPLGAPLMRSLFSLYLGDWNIAITDQIRPDSRIMLRRSVRERVQTLAPMLQWDADPYLVVANGRLVWILDAYTTSSTYPYSRPAVLSRSAVDEEAPDQVNYARNAVKATVDAYTGEVALYAMDPNEPLLRSYAAAFPGLFRPASEITPEIRAHLRYPEDLFRLQAVALTRYHVTSPNVFYSQSDVWAIPGEQRQHDRSTQEMEPYYVMMRLPGEAREEFTLILPFKTRNGTTMAGWLAARCDGPNLGQLRLYRFPTEVQLDAPEQVDNTIQADPVISPQVSLLNQQGSRVIYGNLLVLPVGNSLLYVKPLFVQANGGSSGQTGIPELRRVILAAHQGRSLEVVMRPSLEEALAALVGTEEGETTAPAPTTGATPSPATGTTDVRTLAGEAQAALDAADKAQRAGNWAEYGRQLERLKTAVRRLGGAAGKGP